MNATAIDCLIEGCVRIAYSQSLCKSHHRMLRLFGDPLAPQPQCTMPGCDGPETGRGYCGKHYQRWRKHGDPTHLGKGGPSAVDVTGQRFGSLVAVARDVPARNGGCNWRCACDCGGEAIAALNSLTTGLIVACDNYVVHRQKPHIGYNSMHHRTRRLRGPAKRHSCVDCGQRAHDWSYDYLDPNEQVDGSLRYSLDIIHYQPKCRSCHRLGDRQMAITEEA